MDERKDIEYPMWRKKVDSTLLEDGTTPIPKWVMTLWDIERKFSTVRSKLDPLSSVAIEYEKKSYTGNVSKVKKSADKYTYRLYVDGSLKRALQYAHPVSYMRAYEAKLAKRNSVGKKVTHKTVESESSIWEFVDIEFDVENLKFKFCSHFKAKALFPELFSVITEQFPLNKHVFSEKNEFRIKKHHWFSRKELKNHISANNVIYTLLDSKNKFLYIGRAKNLQGRYPGKEEHHAIPEWDYFRYNVLGDELAPFLDQLERMAIRDMASLLSNQASIDTKQISEYQLVNTVIDKKI